MNDQCKPISQIVIHVFAFVNPSGQPCAGSNTRTALLRVFTLVAAASLLQGCVAASVAGTTATVASTGVSVAATTIKTTAKVAGAGVRMAVPD